MEQLQSFRTELVGWLREIIPFEAFDKYTHKTREGYNHDLNAGRHDNFVNYIFCTNQHRYSISATPWYLGCIASTTFYRPGEDWTRGSDLPDGPFCYQTWLTIKDAVLRYELIKLVIKYDNGVKGIYLPDASNVPDPTPEQKEYTEANGELFKAKQRFERAERAYLELNRRDADTPLSFGKATAHHASETVG